MNTDELDSTRAYQAEKLAILEDVAIVYFLQIYVYKLVCIHMYLCMHVQWIYIYIYICACIMNIYIYVYIMIRIFWHALECYIFRACNAAVSITYMQQPVSTFYVLASHVTCICEHLTSEYAYVCMYITVLRVCITLLCASFIVCWVNRARVHIRTHMYAYLHALSIWAVC